MIGGFKASWFEGAKRKQLRRIDDACAELLRHAGVPCPSRAYWGTDGKSRQLVVELRSATDWSRSYVAALKGLLVHGLNHRLRLDLSVDNFVLALAGDYAEHIPSFKAALNRLQSAPAATGTPTSILTAAASTPPPGLEVSEFTHSQWRAIDKMAEAARQALPH